MSFSFAARWARSCVLALVLVTCVKSAPAADDVSAEAYFPAETYLFVSCPSVADLKERVGESSLGKLWSDRAMSAFQGEFNTHLEQLGAKVQEEVGIPLTKLLELPEGEVALGVCKVNNKLGAALIMDVGENTDTLAKVRELVNAKLSEDGTKTTETYEDIEITVLTNNRGEKGQVTHFVDESYFAVTVGVTGLDLAKALIDRWDGENEKSFAKNSVFNAIKEECEESDDAYSDLYYYIDPVNFALETQKQNPRTAGNAAMAQGFLPILGLDKLKAIGGCASFESEDFDSVSRTMFYVDQPAAGVLGVFKMPATLEGPPKWVDKNVDSYSGFTWDVAGAYASIDGLVKMFMPQAGGLDALMDQAANHPVNPGIHPKKDLLDQLTGVMHMISTEAPDGSAEAQRVLLAIGVKDELTVQNVLEKVASKVPNLKARQFEGVTIYDIEGAGATSPGLAVTRGHLFFATVPAALESAIRGKTVAEEPLADAADYKAVAEHFETPASSIGFSRPAVQIKGVWEQARSGAFAGQIPGLDLTKLPEFSVVEKYFAPSGSFLAPHEKGAIMVNFSLPVE